MPTTPLTSDQYDIVLSGGYRASEYMIVCPSTVIFAARVNGTPAANVFAQFAYDTVTTGADTDIKIGQAILVSRTNDIRAAFFRGRIRATPTSSILYINETSDAIQDGDMIFVLDTYDITERLRHGNLVDWDVEFHKIPPTIKSADDDHPLQSAYAVLTTEATATFDLSVVMQVLSKGATEGTYHWILNDVTYTVGGDTDPTITFEVDTPYNQWGRLEYEDSNGTPNWFAFTITAGDPNNPAHDFFRLCHEPVDYSADLENGYSASVSYWDGVDDLLDQTRIAVVVDEAYNDGDAELNNIRFVGYFTEDNGDVRGDERHGQLKNVSINLAGFLQIAGETTFYSLIIAHDTTPADWEQIDTPTPVRIAAHIILEHSTLGNLAAIDWGVIDDAYFVGPTIDIPDGSVMDAANAIAGKINASFTQDGGGQLVFRRNANFLTDDERDALDTVTPDPITLGEGLSFSLKHTHRRRVRAVNVNYSVYSSVTNEKVFITGRAPANGAGQGPEEREISEQLLDPQSDMNDVIDEAEQRAGHWLEYLNSVDTLTVTIDDGFGFISPANDQWYKFDIPAADLPRGVAIASTDRWLCISIAPKLNERGGRDVQAVFRRESKGGNANIFAAVDPANTDTSLEVMPIYPSYGGDWSPAPSINYEDVNPDIEQPFDADDMSQTLPLPAEQGAGGAAGLPPPGWYKMRPAVNFKNEFNVATDWLTTLGAPYLLKFTGSAGIRTPDTACSEEENFSVGTVTDHTGDVFTVDAVVVGAVYRITWGNNVDGANCCDVDLVATSGSISSGTVIDCAGNSISFAPSLGEVRYINAESLSPFTLELTITGGGSGGEYDLFGDAFYQGQRDPNNPGVWINVSRRDGVYVDNAPIGVAPPLYNDNHEYTVSLADFNAGAGGTGNVINIRYQDDDGYSNNQNLDLETLINGDGAGT